MSTHAARKLLKQREDKQYKAGQAVGKANGRIAPHMRAPMRSDQKRPLWEQRQIEIRAANIARCLKLTIANPDTPAHEKERARKALKEAHEIATKLWLRLADRTSQRPPEERNPERAKDKHGNPTPEAKKRQALEPRGHGMGLIAAMLRSPYGKQVHEMLSPSRLGAPACRDLARAVIERNLWSQQPISLKEPFDDFSYGGWPLQQWAYGSPLARSTCKSYEAMTQLIQGRKKPAIKGILDLVDPEPLRDMAVAAYLDVQEVLTWKHAGRVMGLDGTKQPTNRSQVQSVSEAHERLLQNGIDGDAFGYHGGGDGWRGFCGLYLTDLLGPCLAPAMAPIPASQRERGYTADLIIDFLKRANAEVKRRARAAAAPGEEDEAERTAAYTRLELVVGDSEYMDQKLCEDLVFRVGVQFIFPWRQGAVAGDLDWAAERGWATCPCTVSTTGQPQKMKYVKAEGFWSLANRAAAGLEPGDDIRRHPACTGGKRPRIRFKCEICGHEKTVPITKHNAHLMTFYPFEPSHPERHRQRLSYLALRQGSESLNAALKFRCYGLTGAIKPRCINSERQMRWYAYGRNLQLIVRQLVLRDGSYTRILDAIRRSGIDSANLYDDLRRAGYFAELGEIE